jgi:hypothetical protein
MQTYWQLAHPQIAIAREILKRYTLAPKKPPQ